MEEITHDKLKKIGRIHYYAGVSVLVHGPPGIGKSQTIKSLAKDLKEELKEGNFQVVDIRLAQTCPEDLKGLPSLDKEAKTTEWLVPNFLPKTGKGIIFLDEIGQAPPSIQAAALQLVLDRKLGDYVVPEGYGVFAATNSMEDRSHVHELGKALQNRFAHYKLLPPTISDSKAAGQTDWTDWAIKEGVWENIVFFLKFKSTNLYKFVANDTDPSFATPRSWELASKLIKTALDKGETDIQLIRQLMGGCVGVGVATEFIGWYKLNKKLDLNEILKHPKLAADIKEIDMQYTLACGLVGKYKQDKKLIEPIIDVVGYIPAEMGVLTLRMCMQMSETASPREQNEFKKKLLKSPTFSKYVDEKKWLAE